MRKVISKVKGFVFMGLAAISLAGVSSANAAVPGCGNGFELTPSPDLEIFLASTTQGNVNGDGFVCLKFLNGNGRFDIVIIDNKSQGHEPDPE
jgi:hypothetical protein